MLMVDRGHDPLLHCIAKVDSVAMSIVVSRQDHPSSHDISIEDPEPTETLEYAQPIELSHCRLREQSKPTKRVEL